MRLQKVDKTLKFTQNIKNITDSDLMVERDQVYLLKCRFELPVRKIMFFFTIRNYFEIWYMWTAKSQNEAKCSCQIWAWIISQLIDTSIQKLVFFLYTQFIVYVIFHMIVTETFHVRIFCPKLQTTEPFWGRITHLKTSLQALINLNYWPLHITHH